ncbi:AAA family ATPase [Verrucosispora sp. WMMD703]|uniref:AAA family ATPase n=1 Tax=Verrucosispora sp. WMMD703 TaxID=3403463 RepID=UPI003B948733
MTGVVADFLAELIQLNPQDPVPTQRSTRSNRPEIADMLEQEILHGTVGLLTNPLGYSEVYFQEGDAQYPLFRTSSMISELAPVVLYLRYVLGRGDLLALEEPEAHLHPANQVAFARNIVRLANRGIQTVLTTHSEFFLEKLNNSIVAESLGDEAAMEAGFDEETRIRHTRVSAYFFEPSADGTVVRELPVTASDGIGEVGFGEVEESLYNENIALAESAAGTAK